MRWHFQARGAIRSALTLAATADGHAPIPEAVDAYAYVDFTPLEGVSVNLRAGQQVMRWRPYPVGPMRGQDGLAQRDAAKAALANADVQLFRAEELLRLGQVARLNTLGELAAGMAHELNQPLTAILANTQAAQSASGWLRNSLRNLGTSGRVAEARSSLHQGCAGQICEDRLIRVGRRCNG